MSNTQPEAPLRPGEVMEGGIRKMPHAQYVRWKEEEQLKALLATPHSPIGVFDLPCGLLLSNGVLLRQVQIHEISGEEEDLLGSETMESFQKSNELIARCIRKVFDPETAEVIDQRRELDRVPYELTSGDRAYVLFMIRRVTIGDPFPFIEACPNPGCGEEDLYVFNLSDLVIKPMAEPKKRVYEETLPSGKRASWHVATGTDEHRLAEEKEKDRKKNVMSRAIFARMELLDGKTPGMAQIKELGMGDRQYLRDRFEEVEGGVDTTIEMTCRFCKKDFMRDLDTRRQGFFFPSRVLKDWKKKSSSF